MDQLDLIVQNKFFSQANCIQWTQQPTVYLNSSEIETINYWDKSRKLFSRVFVLAGRTVPRRLSHTWNVKVDYGIVCEDDSVLSLYFIPFDYIHSCVYISINQQFIQWTGPLSNQKCTNFNIFRWIYLKQTCRHRVALNMVGAPCSII